MLLTLILSDKVVCFIRIACILYNIMFSHFFIKLLLSTINIEKLGEDKKMISLARRFIKRSF